MEAYHFIFMRYQFYIYIVGSLTLLLLLFLDKKNSRFAVCILFWSLIVLCFSSMSPIVYQETWTRVVSGFLTYVGLIVALFKLHKLK